MCAQHDVVALKQSAQTRSQKCTVGVVDLMEVMDAVGLTLCLTHPLSLSAELEEPIARHQVGRNKRHQKAFDRHWIPHGFWRKKRTPEPYSYG